jgi:hypothetical protein
MRCVGEWLWAGSDADSCWRRDEVVVAAERQRREETGTERRSALPALFLPSSLFSAVSSLSPSCVDLFG